ncbi:MAG: ParB/RepB/Spo0J family partition protein, partial [Ornithinimicrobium sp.]
MTTRTLLDLKPSEILTHPSNPRRDVGDVTELAASLKAHGLLQNLVVAPRPEKMKGPKAARFVLIAGHRRLAAAKKAKLPTVAAVVDEALTDPADQLSAMLVENGQRADLSPIEEATGYQALLDLGVTSAQVAKRVSRPSRHVADRVKLGQLPEGVKEQVHTHQVSLKEAMAMAQFVGDDKVIKQLTKALGNPYQFEWVVQDAQRAR